jgi:hypothetical protein
VEIDSGELACRQAEEGASAEWMLAQLDPGLAAFMCNQRRRTTQPADQRFVLPGRLNRHSGKRHEPSQTE